MKHDSGPSQKASRQDWGELHPCPLDTQAEGGAAHSAAVSEISPRNMSRNPMPSLWQRLFRPIRNQLTELARDTITWRATDQLG